jgi:hypothetical protein
MGQTISGWPGIVGKLLQSTLCKPALESELKGSVAMLRTIAASLTSVCRSTALAVGYRESISLSARLADTAAFKQYCRLAKHGGHATFLQTLANGQWQSCFLVAQKCDDMGLLWSVNKQQVQRYKLATN